METDNKNNKETKIPEPDTNFDSKNRDFQRTEEDIDDVSKSEKEELEERKRRTHEASTKPDKNHVG